MISVEPPLIRDESGTVNVISLIQVAWRYKVLITLTALSLGLIAVYVALTTRPIYRAEVVVAPVSNEDTGAMGGLGSRLGALASFAGVSLGGGGSQESLAVLNSRHVSEEFIRRHNLAGPILRNATKHSLWWAVERFRATVLSVTDSKERGTTTVAVQWTDPKEAAQWANEYVALANEILRARALDDSSRNIRYLKEQIPKTDVVEVQRALYALVESETKINMLANTRMDYAFSVVDPGVVPEDRVWPRRKLIVGTGVVLGGLIGLFLALGHNMWARYSRVAQPT